MHAFVFSLERSTAAKVSILKANGVKELHLHVYYNWHTMNSFFHAPQPHSDIKRCVQPYRSSLCATVAKQHNRWARAAIKEPYVVKAMYENTPATVRRRLSSLYYSTVKGILQQTYHVQYYQSYPMTEVLRENQNDDHNNIPFTVWETPGRKCI